jgi:Tfp pilus assembly protein PilO
VTPDRPAWRTRLLPLFLALAAVNLLVFLAWTLPRGYRLRNATARADVARSEVTRQRQLVQGLRDRATTLVANRADVARFYDKLVGPVATDLLPGLQEVERMARLPGLRPGGRSFQQKEVESTRVERITVTLPLSGSYSQLVGFLREVERSPRFLTVDRVAMRHEESGTELQVVLSLYVRSAADAEGRGARAAR